MNANLTPAQLRKAADITERIQELQAELREALGHEVPTPSSGGGKRKHKMSPAGRAAISAAAKARWAKIGSGKGSGKTTAKGKAKRNMTPAGRAAIAAAVKARWAKAKKVGKSRL